VFGGFEETEKWNGVWTAEEQRHALAFAYYSVLSGWMKPNELERARRAQVQGGKIPILSNPEEAFIYTTVQEAATQVSHRNGTLHLPDKSVFKPVMANMASEEGDHFRVYCEAARAVREAFPDRFLVALREQLFGFRMPGTGIEGFTRHAIILSQAGVLDQIDIYNIWNQMYQEWRVGEIDPQFSQSESALQEINDKLAKMRFEAQKIENDRTLIRDGSKPAYKIKPPFSQAGERVEIMTPRAKKIGAFLARVTK
jgi:acyl-[acyl-carrier-protein] desaturase